jgi:hypothetical protein
MRQRALWLTIAPVLFVTSTLALEPGANPGVIFDLELSNLTSAAPSVSNLHYAIEGHDVKVTMANATGGTSDMIFHGAKQEMVIINHANKTYMVMDKATVDQMVSQLGGVMAQMQEAMKNMPPEQRAAMEKMMAGRLGGAAPAAEPVVMHNTGEHGTEAGYAAVRWEATRGGRKIREMWVASWSSIHGAAEAQAAMSAMAEYGKSMMESLSKSGLPIGRSIDDSLFQFQALNGFPVVTREFGDDGKATSETTLKGARQETIPASEFQPPAGYHQQQLPGRGR